MKPPSHHPCDGHSCDHCFWCDVVGICCQTISPGQRAQVGADNQAQRERLRIAIAQDARTVPAFSELVRREAGGRSQRAPLLLPAVPAPSVVPISRKESIHVEVSRSDR